MIFKNQVNDKLEKYGESSRQAKDERIIKNRGYYKLPQFFRAHIYFLYRYYIKLEFLMGQKVRFSFLTGLLVSFFSRCKLYECEKTVLL